MTRSRAMRAARRRLRPLKRASLGPAGRLLGLALRLTRRRIGIVLVYHRVGDPPGDPARELVPAQSTAVFRSQLALLRRRYRVVPAARLAEQAAQRRRLQRFCVAITFDDDWAGHAEVALPLLAEASLPATFFLSGATLAAPFSFWYERVQEAFDRGLAEPVFGLGAEVHGTAAAVEGLSRERRQAVVAHLDAVLGPPRGGLRRSAVRRLHAAGHEIGFHTRDHDPLTTLTDDELATALQRGREQLEHVIGAPLEALAYPSGRADDRVFAAARRAGFRRGYTTRPEATTPDTDPLRTGRLDPALHTPRSLHLAIGRALLRSPRGGASTPGAQPAPAPAAEGGGEGGPRHAAR